MRRILTAAVLVLAALVSTTAAADDLPSVPRGMEVYILILRSGSGAEPDLAALGGQVLRSYGDRRLVAVPPATAAGLQKHARVAALQPVWTGEEQTSLAISAPAVIERPIVPMATQPWTRTYTYDGSGNILTAGADAFQYDTAGRLISATVNTQAQTYAYDSFGNLTKKGQPISVEANNRLTGANYDDIGDLTAPPVGNTRYAYDALGMMVSLGPTSGDQWRRMIYTADDERIVVLQTDTDDLNITVRGFDNKVLREWHQSPLATEWLRDYIYADGRLVAGERQVPTGDNGLRHYHLDHLGSTRSITRQDRVQISAQDYFPFGDELTSTAQEDLNLGYRPPDPMKFTGHERDYLGLSNLDNDEYVDYMHARYYGAGVGRFLSVDPNAFWELQGGSDEDRAKFRSYLRHPQRWNRYAYVSNNPINKIDPDGREENFYMEQLFREQQMVGEGKMTEDQYWARRRSEGYGALIGTVGAGGWLLGARAATMGYTAFQAWRAASAAATTIKIIEQTSRGDARIFQTAMNFARGSANNFTNNLTALSRAVEQVVGPQGRITQIGTIGGQAVWGSARTGYGITVINGVTKIVQMIGDDKYRIIGNFR